MNYIKHLSAFFEKVVQDNDLNPTHISLYMALFQSWNINRFQNPISITRNEVMRISKIFSKATYHKCVNELHQKGYIDYQPSYNPFKGSLVSVLELDSIYLLQTKKQQRSTKNSQPFEHVNEHAIEQVVSKYQTSTLPSPRQALVSSINNINNTNISNSVNAQSLEKKLKTETIFLEKKEKKKKLRKKKEISEIIPPQLLDVKNFFIDKGISENEGERFYNHFQSNGWLVGGKSKMKNWQASAKNWIMNLQNFSNVHTAASIPVPGNLKTSNQKKYDEPL